MNNVLRNEKLNLFLIGIISIGLYGILSVMFAEERVIFSDGAYYLFNMVRVNGFWIEHLRYGGVFLEFWTWLGLLIQAPIYILLYLSSLGYVLTFLCAFLLLIFHFRDREMAYALLLLPWLLTNENFYWPQSELQIGLVYLLIVFAQGKRAFKSRGSGSRGNISFYLLATFSLLFHPLMIIPLIIGLSYLWILDDNRTLSNPIIMTGLLTLLFYVAFTAF